MAAIEFFRGDSKQIASSAVHHVALLCQHAIEKRGKFTVAFSGGSLPMFLTALEKAIPMEAWSKWFVFFADERIVPVDHPDSNFVACQHIFKNVPENQIFSLPIVDEQSDFANPALLSTRYEELLRSNCEICVSNDMPVLDLCLLGMGPDGHTASLFPGHKLSIDNTSSSGEVSFEGKCVAFLTDSPKLPPERITLTLEAINTSRNIIFVATGSSKADVVSECFRLSESSQESKLSSDTTSGYPCTFVKPNGLASRTNLPLGHLSPLTWYLDYDACSKLQQNTLELSTNFHDLASMSPCAERGAEDTQNPLIPFFVYGTLIRGFGNHRVIQPYLTEAYDAVTSGAKLVHYSDAGFPGMLVAEPSQRVAGELMYVKPDFYDKASKALDELEDYYGENHPNNMYDKRIIDVTVKKPEGERVIKAYSYWIHVKDAETCWGAVPVPEHDPFNSPGLVSWKHFMLSKKLESAGGDWHEKVSSL